MDKKNSGMGGGKKFRRNLTSDVARFCKYTVAKFLERLDVHIIPVRKFTGVP